MNKTIICSPSTGMGDILVLTGIAKHIKDCVIHLQPHISRFARFFRNICSEIILTDNITPMKEIGNDHYGLRKLRALGMENFCYLPYVDVNDAEKQESLALISKYTNPIAFVANSSREWKFDREPPKIFFQKIIDKLSEHHTVLQFGVSTNFTEFDHTVPLVDLPIDSLIKYYYAIGKFIGVDTGDSHLMLAVGGRCDIFIPRPRYRLPQLWNYDSLRAAYHYFN